MGTRRQKKGTGKAKVSQKKRGEQGVVDKKARGRSQGKVTAAAKKVAEMQAQLEKLREEHKEQFGGEEAGGEEENSGSDSDEEEKEKGVTPYTLMSSQLDEHTRVINVLGEDLTEVKEGITVLQQRVGATSGATMRNTAPGGEESKPKRNKYVVEDFLTRAG